MTARRLFIVASIALIVHGLIELLGFVWLLNPELEGPSFIFQDMERNKQVTIGVGIVVGVLRLTAAVGLLRNREWGWVLGLLLSVITFTMLTLYLPAGVTDGIFAGIALASLVIGRYRDKLT